MRLSQGQELSPAEAQPQRPHPRVLGAREVSRSCPAAPHTHVCTAPGAALRPQTLPAPASAPRLRPLRETPVRAPAAAPRAPAGAAPLRRRRGKARAEPLSRPRVTARSRPRPTWTGSPRGGGGAAAPPPCADWLPGARRPGRLACHWLSCRMRRGRGQARP